MEKNTTLARCRAIAQEYGKFFGTQLFTLKSSNPDLTWKEDVMADKNTLRKPMMFLTIEAVDITSVGFLDKDLDKNPKIILNQGTNKEMVFPVAKPTFGKANRETVTVCIDSIEKAGTTPTFFAAEELPELIKYVKLHNNGVIQFYEDMCAKMMNLAGTVRSVNEMQDRIREDYMAECGISKTEVEVQITATVAQ